MQKHILIVEDEIAIREMITFSLMKQKYNVSQCGNGLEALEFMANLKPDLMIIDWGLPKMNGMQLVEKIRNNEVHADIPIIMLTARKTENDRIIGLKAGVDDYVCKPFSAKELMLRIQAVLKRAGIFNENKVEGLQLDKNGYFLRYNDQQIKLTHLEFALLNFLSQKPGRIYSREQILEFVYNNDRDISDRAIDSHIKNIRKKIRAINIDQNIIETTYGAGFRFVPIE